VEPAHIAQCASLFLLGVLAGPRRWLETMPARRGFVWLGIGIGLVVGAYVMAATGLVGSGASGHGAAVDERSRSWQVCTVESFLCVGLCVGLPVVSRELALGTCRLWRVLAANVFAVYVFHMPIVLLLQWALIDAPAPKWVRLVATVVGAILVSFAFTNFVILRLPYARRVF
jgi:hypothetical protein